jgi:hypothetical protein
MRSLRGADRRNAMVVIVAGDVGGDNVFFAETYGT